MLEAAALQGLTSAEARQRLTKYGANMVAAVPASLAV